MKKSIRGICLILSVVMILLIFPACRLQHFEEDEITAWAKESFGSSVVVSEDYTERPSSDDEDFTDRVWIAYLEDRPDLRFEIISHEYWGMESVTHSMESTYGYVYGKYFFEEYLKENATDFEPEYTEPVTYDYYLKADFSDRDDLSRIIDQAEDISSYMIDNGIDEYVRFTIEFDDVLSAVDDTDISESAGCAPSLDDFEDTLLSEYAIYAADYRLDTDSFTEEELELAADEFGRHFNIIRSDGSVVCYPDLSLSRFGYGMSFGCMYEVFSREGFDVSGSPEHFTFAGIDGCTYEFSYSFNDYPYEEGKSGYYYLKNGSRQPMDYYFYNHFRTHFIEEISGLSFEDI